MVFNISPYNQSKASIKTQQMRSAHKGITQYLICLNCNTQIIIES